MRSATRPESKKRRPSVRHCGPPLLEDPGQRYAACPHTFKIGPPYSMPPYSMPPYSMLGHRAAQRALPNGPQWRIEVVLSGRKVL